MLNISLALIVKPTDQEAKKLDRCLASCASFFNEVVLTITGDNKACEEVALKYNAKVSHYVWENDFAKARNFNFAQVTGDWIVWLDADDVVRGAEKIRENIEMADENKITGISVMYNYAHDKAGKVTQQHWKLQMVKKGFYEWKGIIHENLIGNGICQEASINDVIRVHTATEKDSAESIQRNLVILNEAVKKEPDEPRHYFYLARCYLGVEDWESVILSVERYMELSGWKQERYEALNMMGEAYMRLGMYDDAIKVHTSATLELEDAPDAYIYKARNYIHKEKWNEALTNLQIAELRDKDAVNLKHNALYDHDLYVMSAICMLQLGMFTEAKKAVERAYKNRQSEHSKEILELATEMEYDERLTREYMTLAKTMLEDTERLQALCYSMPEQILNDPRILSVRFAAFPPKKWNENSVAIFCGNSADSWTGNAIQEGGIGGSETAVIHIAENLVKRGKEVVVYNRCDAPREGLLVKGVLYHNYWEFNRLDEFDVLWAWRMPSLADYDIKARKFIVDVHDVMNPESFSPERLARIDHVFVKTEYHKSLFPNIPDDKFVIVGNGIDLSRFDEVVKKDPTRIIYTSTANRGLETILNWWPDIKKVVPKAELHVFYGWNTFYQLNKENPERLAWMERMKEMMKQDGIVDHGRVDQVTLAKEMLKSSIWLYPTDFPEIHCHPKDTYVETKSGDVAIQNLKIDDEVRTMDDTYKKITAIRSREVDEDIYTITPQSGEDIKATGEHPFYVIKGQSERGWKDRIVDTPDWVKAKDLEIDDILVIPRMVNSSQFSIYLDNYTRSENNNLKIDNNFIDTTMTPEKAWFFGYFAGDGNANTRGKISCLVADKHKDKYYEKVVTAYKQFGLPIYERKLQGCIDVYTHSYTLSRFIRDKFYINGVKTVPDDLVRAYPDDVLAGLLAADGHTDLKYKGTGNSYSFCNTSRYLIGVVRKLINHRGSTGRVATRLHKHGTESYTISWTENNKISFYGSDDRFIYIKINKINKEKEKTRVYNIDVDETHNYLANGVIAHNCITALEMQASRVYPITSGYAALKETQQSGVQIPVENKEKYIAEILNAVENPDLLQKDIENGLEYVRSCSWELVTDKWESVLWN